LTFFARKMKNLGMKFSRYFARLSAIALVVLLASCGLPSMSTGDFAVADAAARSTNRWARSDDGKAIRPRYRASNPNRVAQVTYMTASPKRADFESFISGYAGTVKLSGAKLSQRRTWQHRGIEVTEMLYDYGPGGKNNERYVQVLFANDGGKFVVVRTLGQTPDPSAVQGNDLMKAVLDSPLGS